MTAWLECTREEMAHARATCGGVRHRRFHLRQRALRRSAHCTCKRPGHAVDEAIRSAHVTPALREVDVGPTAHRGGGVAFTTAMARRHERRMAAGECLVAEAGYSGRFEAGQQDLFEYLGRKSTARQELDDSPPAALDTADAAGREDGGSRCGADVHAAVPRRRGGAPG